ncbi:MAG: alpha-D-ribose 1-methylphosphonate 5-triphosphate diphosphatase [Sulfitobacter sp.]|nr:alpha-D-ribose 1-methylphosphonate 5-triphosphate diphosphatase [Sulfitobacter sp.]
MPQDFILANAKLILQDEVITGSVHVVDGLISDIGSGGNVPKGAIDAGGDYLAPGLVELHTDNLERHLSPRPQVNWPHRPAILAHDRELVAAGITTVFDAIRVGSILSGNSKRYGKYARQIADEIAQMRSLGTLKISHHLHLRAEICSETLIEELEEFGPNDRVGIVSMMDHTPGQRQFRDMEKYKQYVCGKHGLDSARFEEHVRLLCGLQETLGTRHEAAAVAAARRYGATLASHDDTTADQVKISHQHGVTLAEFPTTVEAAHACHACGIATIMGAPNVVRGASHSGNVAAHRLAEIDRLDILSSDYVPAALLLAAMMLSKTWGNVPRAIATVTSNPARAVGLEDRGKIAIGRRADLIRFADLAGDIVLKHTWALGDLVG